MCPWEGDTAPVSVANVYGATGTPWPETRPRANQSAMMAGKESKMRFLLVTTLFLSAHLAFAQTPASPPKSPNDVVAEFFRFEAGGGRLTADGWDKANEFFVHPVPISQTRTILVVDDNYSVWDGSTKKGNDVMVTVGVLPVGK